MALDDVRSRPNRDRQTEVEGDSPLLLEPSRRVLSDGVESRVSLRDHVISELTFDSVRTYTV